MERRAIQRIYFSPTTTARLSPHMRKLTEHSITAAKLRLLQLHYESKSGHLGGNFSSIDAMMAVHHLVMGEDDRFVLSKGHSAGALYVTLWSLGKVSDGELSTFTLDDTGFPGHPS